MIGDWLLVDGKVTKVTRENINYVLNTLCQPLPLTREFFEKNGWKHRSASVYDGYYLFEDDFFEMCAYELTDGMWVVDYKNIEIGNVPTMNVNVCWVHEVGRFLDLCGVSEDMIKHVEFKGFK